jgi:hypothetical protein
MNPSFQTNFSKCVSGYHAVNDDPIKEAVWEDIYVQILVASGCTVHSKACGSHKSGADIVCDLGDFSNKSTQYDSDKSSFKISSYRLTTVFSEKSPGKAEDIVKEINARKNFKYHSIIVRDDKGGEITYDWYLIPVDHPVFDPASYTWTPKIGKIGKNAGAHVGWATNSIHGSSMSITFSMSSQLWIDVRITDELKSYIVSSHTVKKGRSLNYIQLNDLFSNVPQSK